MKKRISRIVSFLMVLAMVVTLMPTNVLNVRAAAEKNVTLHFLNPDAWTSWEEPALQYWDGSSTLVDNAVSGPTEIEGWGGATGYTLTQGTGNDYYITLKGDFGGFQFLAMNAPSNNTGNVYSTYMEQYNEVTPTDLYYKADEGKWYTDAACTTLLKAPEGSLEPHDVMIITHYQNTKNMTGINAHIKQGSSWTDVQEEEFQVGWPGKALTEDVDHPGYYTTKATIWSGNAYHCIWSEDGNDSVRTEIAIEASDVNACETALEVWVDGDGNISYEKPDGWKETTTIHFYNSSKWDSVNAWIWEKNGGAISGAEKYQTAWPGAAITENSNHKDWYDVTIDRTGLDIETVMAIFSCGAQTGNLEIPSITTATEAWVVGQAGEVLFSAPVEWKGTSPLDSMVSPEVIGNDVTFRYYSSTATQIRVAGEMNGWGDSTDYLTKGDDDVWSITMKLAPGRYQYKFILDSNDWKNDQVNQIVSGGNNVAVVPGLSDGTMQAEKGIAAALPTLTLYAADGTYTEANPTYKVITEAAKDYVTIADGKVTVDKQFTGDSFEIQATADGKTSTIRVTVVDKMYTYTIYYYDWTAEHMATTASALWMWQEGGAGGKEVSFTGSEVLEDGREWLKAVVPVSYYDNIRLIPKVASPDPSSPVWTWQGKTYSFSNSDKKDNCAIYIASSESKAYDTLPTLKEPRERYVEIEYQRTAGDYDGWNIFTWNSGFGSDVTINFAKIGDKMVAKVPVADSEADMQLSFCMRKSTDDNQWAEKDGGDHSVLIPADQSLVKAVFVEGEGIVEVLPYNTGFERDGANDKIHFYYRDDDLSREYKLSSIAGKVEIVIEGVSHEMTYDSTTDRFCYDLSGLTSGKTYHYYYKIDGEKKLDVFNTSATESFQGQECNVCLYKKFEGMTLSAEMSQASMDYNNNNVLTVKATGSDGQPAADFEVAEASVDTSALGTGTMAIDPELMAVTVSCLRGTSTGVKNLPVTIKDIYGNVYNTTAQVTIVARDKTDGDFDWDEAVIYFAVTDRFFDGSSSNNTGANKDGSLSYHGGDFAGLTQKLDYLQDLGVNTIWITPIVENSDVTTDKDGETIESTGYHGYWASDFTKLNSHLGTEAEFKALIDGAHSRNMKIMVDVVVNHAGYGTEDHFNTIIQDAEGNYVSMLRDEETTISGDTVRDGLAGLPDFVTENPDVRNQIIQWQTDWMKNYDIDYYRVDTVKHVEDTTWSAFKNSLTKVNPDFKMIGEYSGGGYSNDFDQLGTGKMDSLLDFDFNDIAKSFVLGNITGAEATLEQRNSVINNTYALGSFMNSHDEDGLQDKLQNPKEGGNLSEAEAKDMMKVAATLMITAKGQPIIYYGEELGQYGKDNYPYQTNRYDFDWAELAKQQADSNSIYNHYKTMLAIRNDYTDVFVQGNRKSVAASDAEGYEVISRSYGDTTLYIGMNIKDAAKEVTIPVSGEAGSVYTNLYDGKEYTVSADQKVTISIPAAKNGGTIVLAEKVAEDDSFLRYIEVSSDDYSEVINSVTKATDGTITVVLPADSKKIPAEIFNKAAGKDITLVFVVADSASWTVSAKTITSTIAAAIDLNVTLNTSNIPADIVSALAGNNKTMQLSLAHDGAFGFDGSLTLSVGDTYKGKYANLYYYNPTTKGLEYQQAAKVTEDGKVTYGFKHASEYVIVFADTDLKPADPKPADPSTPTAPTTPTTPTTPTAPTTPATPADTTAKETPTVEAPKTGDETPVAGFAVALMASGLALALLLRKKTKRSK